MDLKNFNKIVSLVFSGVLVFILVNSTSVMAHNKVVVIPMAGDDISPDPFAPVAANQPLNSHYTIGATTVIDKITGLQWQKTDDSTTRTWAVAVTYCADLTLGSKTDWRLPSVLELQSIVDYNAFNAAINGAAFPDTKTSLYWSASSVASDSGIAWGVIFNDGNVFADDKTDSDYVVRCVR